MSQSIDPAEPEEPFYKRWWFVGLIAIAALLIGLAIGNLGGSESETPPVAASSTTSRGETTTTEASSTTTSSSSTTTSAPTTTTTQVTTTTTTAPATTTTLPGEFESFTLEGVGDDVFEYSIPGDAAAVLDITHEGSSNIIVTSFTADNDRIEGLVNEIGAYEGTVGVNFVVNDFVGLLEVRADGAWSITARPLAALDYNEDQASGDGDDVVFMVTNSFSLDMTHDGESNFIVRAWTSDDTDILVNEIGTYSGTVRTLTGNVFYEITADGNWTLSSS